MYRSRYLLVALLLVLVLGFRREVGSDWGNYLHIFSQIKEADLGFALRTIEPGYGLLNWIAVQAGWGIWFPNVVCAAIFTWGLIALCRLQPNPWLALLVAFPYFIVGVGMGYTRQSAALGFIMVGIAQFLKGKPVSMFVCLAIAPVFHASAVVALPLVGLGTVRRGVGMVAMLAVLGAILIFAFSGEIASRITAYSQGEFTAGGAVPRIMMNVLPALLFLGYRHRFTANPAEQRLWITFAGASLLSGLMLFFVNSTTVVDRLGIYLIPLQIFVLSRVPTVFTSKRSQNMLPLLLIVAYSLTVEIVWLTLGNFGAKWLPYNNYLWDWSPTVSHRRD